MADYLKTTSCFPLLGSGNDNKSQGNDLKQGTEKEVVFDLTFCLIFVSFLFVLIDGAYSVWRHT